MKKLAFIIIAVLPIFLVVTIGLASRIYSQEKYIYVESIIFVDEKEDPYEDGILRLSPNDVYQLNYQVYPMLATNTKVSFYSDDESLCTVNQEGMITVNSQNYGSTYITVKTQDGGKIARLLIYVYSDQVLKLVLNSPSELSLTIGENTKMDVEVFPHTATNKTINWSSSDEAVCRVDVNGKITAVGVGLAVITATTKDGAHTVSCTLDVIENAYLSFVDKNGDIIETNVFDLASYIEYCDPAYLAQIRYRIINGEQYASINGSIITIEKDGEFILVQIKLDVNGKVFLRDYILMLKN